MGTLFLCEADVKQLLSMRAAIDAVEEAFRALARGDATNAVRQRARGDALIIHNMCAVAGHLGYSGFKSYTTTPQSARFHVGLYDMASGELVALMEANHLGQVRTGATTGVAVSYMAVPEACEMGLFGSGFQAETQLEAIQVVRPLKRCYVYSRNEERRIDFAQRMSERLNLEVIPADRPVTAAEDLPVVVTATSSKEPVFDGADLAENATVCAVGSNWLNRAEIDATTVRLADSIVCDSVAACRQEAGDFTDALERGVFDWNRAVELADVVAGRSLGHTTRQSVRLFKSVGLAIEDVAVAALVYQRAREQGLGQVLPI